MTDNRSLNFWAERSKGYNQLEWANNQALIAALLHSCKFKISDTVLDVGTGSGIVARAIAPLVEKVIGVDYSLEMLQRFDGAMPFNCYVIKGDIRETMFRDNVFDAITARYAIHHFVGFAVEALRECYRVLKPNGKMAVCEGTPPSKRLRNDYTKIFALKEYRLTLDENDITSLMVEAGFKNIESKIMWLRNMSVKNWLDSSGLDESIRNTIYDMHVNSSPAFKEDYNLILTKDGKDCLIDMRQVILVGTK